MNETVVTANVSEEDLRLLYLDWCSTRIAKRFLELSLDEVWLRSNLAASSPPNLPPQAPPESASDVALDLIPDYLDLVRKTTLLLAEEMKLPLFDQWRDAYLQDPKAFQKDILRKSEG